MPHGSDRGDDFASTDEVKVYKEEGGDEEENKSSSENLSEEKLGLLTESEQGKGSLHSSVGSCCSISDSQFGFGGCLADYYSFHGRIPFGYSPLINSYSYATGSAIPGLNNVSILPPRTWFYMYNNSSGSQPYMGLPPPPPPPPPSLRIGHHTGYSPSSSMFHLSGASPSHQLPHLFVPNDLPTMSCFDHFSQSNSSLYPHPFGSSYLPSVMSGSSLSHLNRGNLFASQPPQHLHHHIHHNCRHQSPAMASPSPSACPKLPRPGVSHPVLVSTAKEDGQSALPAGNLSSAQKVWFPVSRSSESSNCNWSASEKPVSSSQSSSSRRALRRMHVKKPLNAFMLFMKEMRPKVIDECTLKESAAINQILGRKWHSLEQSEQNKYYEMARKEKLLHHQMFPGWSARDNYATQARKKKKREQMNQVNHRLALREEERDGSVLKKCRARYGLDQQHRWCKPCRRKKKCIKFLDDNNTDAGEARETNSCSSSQMAPAADSTVNEFQLLSSSKTSSKSENDCLLDESSEVPHSCHLIPVRSQSQVGCEEELSPNCHFYPNSKSFVSSWSDGTCSSTCSSRQPFLNPVKSLGSSRRISTTCLSNS